MPASNKSTQPKKGAGVTGTANLSGASNEVLSQQNQSILSFLLSSGSPAPTSTTTTTTAPFVAPVDNRTLFEKFFGIDLTSVTFILVGVILVVVALLVFFQQASKAAAPYVLEAAASAAKAAV